MCNIRQVIVTLRLERGSTKLYNILWETDNLVFVKMLKLIVRYVLVSHPIERQIALKMKGWYVLTGRGLKSGIFFCWKR